MEGETLSSTRQGTVEIKSSRRRTRQSARRNAAAADAVQLGTDASLRPSKDATATAYPALLSSAAGITSSRSTSVKALPAVLTRKLTGLTKEAHMLLMEKQRRLRLSQIQISMGPPDLANAVGATLVFAQYEAGTAVCISLQGVLLTCSHCVAESEDELRQRKTNWLLFASGQIIQAECKTWAPRRDLALLKIVAAQPRLDLHDETGLSPTLTTAHIYSLPLVTIARPPLSLRTPLLCIGHPGSEDLEVSRTGVDTGYDVLHISEGQVPWLCSRSRFAGQLGNWGVEAWLLDVLGSQWGTARGTEDRSPCWIALFMGREDWDASWSTARNHSAISGRPQVNKSRS